MFWYIYRHNVAETYAPNSGAEICSVAHGRRASSDQSKVLCSRSSNFPCFSFEPGASGLTAGPFACYWQTSRRHGILSSCNYLLQTRSTSQAHRLGYVPAGHGVLRRGVTLVRWPGSWTGWRTAWWLGGNRTCRSVLIDEVQLALIDEVRYALIVRNVLVDIVIARHWNIRTEKNQMFLNIFRSRVMHLNFV